MPQNGIWVQRGGHVSSMNLYTCMSVRWTKLFGNIQSQNIDKLKTLIIKVTTRERKSGQGKTQKGVKKQGLFKLRALTIIHGYVSSNPTI